MAIDGHRQHLHGVTIDNDNNQQLGARPRDENDSMADDDSGYWALEPSTRSVASSIYDYERAHGRTFHAFHRGKYYMPNDADEQTRLEVKYHAVRLALNGTLYFAPIERPYNVLDVGTGTGLWAIDVADEHPQATVIGTDLSPIMSDMVPPNLEFEIHDADEAWTFTRKFDLIHCRIMNDFTLRDWPQYFVKAYENLVPGGWVECHEFDYHRQSDDNTIPADSRLRHWENEWTRGIQMLGMQGACDPHLVVKQMSEAGFVNIQLKNFKMPIGPWPKDPKKKECGMYGMINLLDGISGLSAKIFPDLLAYSQQDLQMLLFECREEVLRREIHSYYPIFVILGQKPEAPLTAESGSSTP